MPSRKLANSAAPPTTNELEQIRRIALRAYIGLCYTHMLAYCAPNEAGHNAYRFCCTALFNDMFGKLCAVLDCHKTAHSFWRAYDRHERLAEKFLARNSMRYRELQEISERIRPVRNKTHFHLDLASADNWRLLWSDAKVTRDQAAEAFTDVIGACNAMLEMAGASTPVFPPYDGTDFARLMERACDERIIPRAWPDGWRLKA